MRELLFCGELGYVPYVRSRKEWIATAIGAVGGFASSLIGGRSASSANEAAISELKQQKAKDDAWYNRRYYEDYVDTAVGQNLVRKFKRQYDASIKQAKGAEAVSGGTPASTQMAKDSMNNAMGEMYANIAATDQMNKMHIDEMRQRNDKEYSNRMANLETQRAQNITNAAQAASNAMMSIGSAVDQASAKTTNLNGGSNNSEVKTSGAETPGVTSTQVGGKTYTRAGNGTWFDEFGNPVAGKA